jgi:8-amino-7-oxononanoate synthase
MAADSSTKIDTSLWFEQRVRRIGVARSDYHEFATWRCEETLTMLRHLTPGRRLRLPDRCRVGLDVCLTIFDFTSSLYLGMRHPSGALKPFRQLTVGVPAAFRSPPEAQQLAGSLARLMGCSAGILGTSTLHIFWDLFCILCRRQSAVLIVGEIYPIALWGVERAAALGVPIDRVAAHDPGRVSRRAQAWSSRGIRPIIVTDGIFFPEGGIAPLCSYSRAAAASGGLLVIDDTQGLGILGNHPTAISSYGRGGGGSFRFHGLSGPHLVGVCSLAKAFGVPVAVLAGSGPMVRAFASRSATRQHSSPPSMAVLAAGIRAISINRRCGEDLRARLLDNIRRFRHLLAGVGLRPAGGLMPVQTLSFGSEEAGGVDAGLARAGIRALVTPEPGLSGGRIIFVITAKHQPTDLERAALALKAILPPSNRLSSVKGFNPDRPGTVSAPHKWAWSGVHRPALPRLRAL